MKEAIQVLTAKLAEARAGLAKYVVDGLAGAAIDHPSTVPHGTLAGWLETIDLIERAIVALGGVVPVEPADRVPEAAMAV
jgi:hypothetical protein